MAASGFVIATASPASAGIAATTSATNTIINGTTINIGVIHVKDGSYAHGQYDVALPPDDDTAGNLGWSTTAGWYTGPGYCTVQYRWDANYPIWRVQKPDLGPGQHFIGPDTSYQIYSGIQGRALFHHMSTSAPIRTYGSCSAFVLPVPLTIRTGAVLLNRIRIHWSTCDCRPTAISALVGSGFLRRCLESTITRGCKMGMKSTFATIAVALTVAALVMPVPAEAAPRMLYVDNTDGSGCSDVGRGTQQQPFCTIQVAADTVVPGTTVDITGEYQESVTVGRSGTPRAPIVFQSENRNFTWVDGTSGGPAFTMHGVHDVVIRALSIAGGSVDHDAIFITGSQRVIVDSNALSIPSPEAQGSVVRVTGASRSITVSRNLIDSSYGYAAIRIDSAGVGNVVSANDISGGGNTGVRVADSPAAAVTGNTVIHSCNRGGGGDGPILGSQCPEQHLRVRLRQ
ncbi:right-handed parallel beta-helix repeat-containing protein [Fodinicola feengrottensis]|uniref:right-handed parallel beta-helix repeat-containing protein n=1 Tax=Fodinicola feengrottensis TaxID=435914 RepID=UPI0013D52202|nr:right-handed parallel beta-helix repeat-containing protein [Fodinicola feengrottensis]